LLALGLDEKPDIIRLEPGREFSAHGFKLFRPGHSATAIPAGRVVVTGGATPLMLGVGFLAAHEDGDTVMGARDDELVAQGTQFRHAPTA
jgi:hypothetical protein